MIKVKIICFFLIGFIHKIYSQSLEIKNDSIIPWSKECKLKWIDFKGVKDSSHFHAISSLQIRLTPETLDYDSANKINAFAVFSKNESWVLDKQKSDNLLKHEQVHFDIIEIYAREIRKEFETLKSLNVRDLGIYVRKFKSLTQKCFDYQYLYDRETNHGSILEKQEEWNKKVSQRLLELSDYESFPTPEEIIELKKYN